jgi:hypothetical protein
MTTIEIATAAEQAVDALTTRLNAAPDHTPEVAEKLRGIAHSLLLAVGTIASTSDGETAEKAGDASDVLLASLPALDELADAMREDEYQRTIAA